MKPTLYLINGPLGAGKTTFLRNLLKQPGFEAARVIENEFASTSVDTDQLHDHHAEVQTIAGVCICCSTGDELTDALRDLSKTSEPVVIEATGIANSLKLIEKIVIADMLDVYDITHAVFILDAVEASADLVATLATYKHELQAADTVLVSKTDLLSTSQLNDLFTALRKLTIHQLDIVSEGEFDTKLLSTQSRILEYFANLDERIDNHESNSNYTIVDTGTFSFDTQNISTLWAILRDAYGLRRMKGNIKDVSGTIWHVEATPSQCKVTGYDAGGLQLVLIGKNATAIHEAAIKDILSNE